MNTANKKHVRIHGIVGQFFPVKKNKIAFDGCRLGDNIVPLLNLHVFSGRARAPLFDSAPKRSGGRWRSEGASRRRCCCFRLRRPGRDDLRGGFEGGEGAVGAADVEGEFEGGGGAVEGEEVAGRDRSLQFPLLQGVVEQGEDGGDPAHGLHRVVGVHQRVDPFDGEVGDGVRGIL